MATTSGNSPTAPCYCLGARHRVLTNCLECGYLVCAQDASPTVTLLPSFSSKQDTTLPDSSDHASLFCPICRVPCILPYSGAEIRNIYGTDSTDGMRTVRAYEMKDRLLQFDQEHAQRTKVYDAQGDYYNAAGNMSWLSEQERNRLESVEKKRRELLNSRSRMGRKVNIVFNIAGQRVVDVDPYLDLDLDGEDEDAESVEDEKTIAEMSNESRRIQVCKAILDERDQEFGDSTLLSSGASAGSWAAVGNDALKAKLQNSDAMVSNERATDAPETATDPAVDPSEPPQIISAVVSDSFEDRDKNRGLENTTMQLQGTRAAETYRFMRQNFQQLFNASSDAATAIDHSQKLNQNPPKKIHKNNNANQNPTKAHGKSTSADRPLNNTASTISQEKKQQKQNRRHPKSEESSDVVHSNSQSTRPQQSKRHKDSTVTPSVHENT